MKWCSASDWNVGWLRRLKFLCREMGRRRSDLGYASKRGRGVTAWPRGGWASAQPERKTASGGSAGGIDVVGREGTSKGGHKLQAP